MFLAGNAGRCCRWNITNDWMLFNGFAALKIQALMDVQNMQVPESIEMPNIDLLKNSGDYGLLAQTVRSGNEIIIFNRLVIIYKPVLLIIATLFAIPCSHCKVVMKIESIQKLGNQPFRTTRTFQTTFKLA